MHQMQQQVPEKLAWLVRVLFGRCNQQGWSAVAVVGESLSLLPLVALVHER